jgi:hypothetical protein
LFPHSKRSRRSVEYNESKSSLRPRVFPNVPNVHDLLRIHTSYFRVIGTITGHLRPSVTDFLGGRSAIVIGGRFTVKKPTDLIISEALAYSTVLEDLITADILSPVC